MLESQATIRTSAQLLRLAYAAYLSLTNSLSLVVVGAARLAENFYFADLYI